MAKLRKSSLGNKAVLYLRVSTLEQAKEGVSLDAQLERLKAYCQMAGLSVEAIFREEGVSGTIPLAKRPEGKKLLEIIENDHINNVVSLKLDRLFRNAVNALQQTEEWDKAGIALHLVDMGGASLATGSAMGKMLITMMAGFAEFERNLIAERTTSALEHMKSHRQAFNHTPYGFQRIGDQFVEHPQEISIVKLIQERRQDGWSYKMIADALNEDGIPTKQNGKWRQQTIKNLCESKLLAETLAA